MVVSEKSPRTTDDLLSQGISDLQCEFVDRRDMLIQVCRRVMSALDTGT